MRSVLLAIDSIPSSYLGQPIVHLHFVTKFKSWTLGFSLRVPNRSPSYDPILLWFVLASCRPSGRPAVSGAYTLKVEKLSFDARTLSHSLAVPETEPLPRGLPVGTPLAPRQSSA